MKIIFVVPRLPFPPDTGAKIRTLNLLRQLSRENSIVLLAFSYGRQQEEAQAAGREGLKVITIPHKEGISAIAFFNAVSKGLPLSVSKYRNIVMEKRIRQLVKSEKPHFIHFDHVHMGQYMDVCPELPFVLDEHNVECIVFRRLADKEMNPFKKAVFVREYRAMERLEKKICNDAFRVLAVSENDETSLLSLCGNSANISVVPNGVDTGYFQTGPFREEEDSLIFTGSMDWLPNSDAVLYFCSSILPAIWEQRPLARFYIVGRNPPQDLKRLALSDKRMVLTGNVADVRPFMARSSVFVAPLRSGGGTRLKILEAMSMGIPVVSTVIGAEGIKAVDGRDIMIAQGPEDFAKKTVRLLGSPEKRKEIAGNARRLVEDLYDWRIIGRKLRSVYSGVEEGSPRNPKKSERSYEDKVE